MGTWESEVKIIKKDVYGDYGFENDENGKKQHIKSVEERIKEKFGNDVEISFLDTYYVED